MKRLTLIFALLFSVAACSDATEQAHDDDDGHDAGHDHEPEPEPEEDAGAGPGDEPEPDAGEDPSPEPDDAGATPEADAGPAPVCVAGQQVACACLGAAEGVQACKDDGSGFEACECEAPTPQEGLSEFGLYRIRVVSYVVEEKSAADATWDAFGGAPDVYVCIGHEGAEGCTAVCEDNVTRCTFQGDDGLLLTGDMQEVLFFGGELSAGVPIGVWDIDTISSHDSIGSGWLISTTADGMVMSTGAFGQVVNLELLIEAQ